MGTRTLVGHEAGSAKPVWVLFCSVDGHAFGRIMPGTAEDMQAFLDWYEQMYGDDPRKAEPDALLVRQDAWAEERRHDAIRLREAQALMALVKP